MGICELSGTLGGEEGIWYRWAKQTTVDSPPRPRRLLRSSQPSGWPLRIFKHINLSSIIMEQALPAPAS